MFSYGLLIFLVWHLRTSVGVGGRALLSLTTVAACLSAVVWTVTHTFSAPAVAASCYYWWAMSCERVCLSRVVGRQEKNKLKTIGVENYTSLAINRFVKSFKKIRWRVELEEFFLGRMTWLFHLFLALWSLNNFIIRGDILISILQLRNRPRIVMMFSVL